MKNSKKVDRNSEWWKQFSAKVKSQDKAWNKAVNKKTVGCSSKAFFNGFKVEVK
jgi:hypothetical protein